MKKTLLLMAVAVLVLGLSSCKSNMRRDVKRLVHKTEQCFSLVDPNALDNAEMDEFNECYEDLISMMEKYEKKYQDKNSVEQFDILFREELQKSKLDNSVKDMFDDIYALSDELSEID